MAQAAPLQPLTPSRLPPPHRLRASRFFWQSKAPSESPAAGRSLAAPLVVAEDLDGDLADLWAQAQLLDLAAGETELRKARSCTQKRDGLQISQVSGVGWLVSGFYKFLSFPRKGGVLVSGFRMLLIHFPL